MPDSNQRVFVSNVGETSDIPSGDDIEQKKLFDKRENKHFHWVKIGLIWIFGAIIAAIAIVLVLHLLIPAKNRWLTKEETSNLQQMFVTGIGAAMIGKFGNKLAN